MQFQNHQRKIQRMEESFKHELDHNKKEKQLQRLNFEREAKKMAMSYESEL